MTIERIQMFQFAYLDFCPPQAEEQRSGLFVALARHLLISISFVKCCLGHLLAVQSQLLPNLEPVCRLIWVYRSA